MSVGRGRWRRGRVSVYITLHNSWSCHRRERRIMVPYWSWPPLSMVRRRQPTWIRRMTITTRTTPWPGLVVVQCSGFTHRALGTLRRVVCLHNAVIFRRIVAGNSRMPTLLPSLPNSTDYTLEIVCFLSTVESSNHRSCCLHPCTVYISGENY